MTLAAEHDEPAEYQQAARIGEQVMDSAVKQRSRHDPEEPLLRARQNAEGLQAAAEDGRIKDADRPYQCDKDSDDSRAPSQVAIFRCLVGGQVELAPVLWTPNWETIIPMEVSHEAQGFYQGIQARGRSPT